MSDIEKTTAYKVGQTCANVVVAILVGLGIGLGIVYWRISLGLALIAFLYLIFYTIWRFRGEEK